ncbi:unnamed protein product [Trichogramma brassicae]|uniref:Uncharacterized protein n=1 Tax=Trichogramma brassicae TaxID=86971 RepID=A0A6H5I6E4_9HYME|nr:unnamed protein product [Trichogramma brassicae]
MLPGAPIPTEGCHSTLSCSTAIYVYIYIHSARLRQSMCEGAKPTRDRIHSIMCTYCREKEAVTIRRLREGSRD